MLIDRKARYLWRSAKKKAMRKARHKRVIARWEKRMRKKGWPI